MPRPKYVLSAYHVPNTVLKALEILLRTKHEIHSWDYIEIKSFCIAEEMKRQPKEW